MITYDGDELLARYAAIEKEAIALVEPAYPPCDAFPGWFRTSERFPYWANALSLLSKVASGEDSFGDEGAVYDVTLWNKLVIAHPTDGLRGEVDERYQRWLPDLVQYFETTRWLQSVAYPTPMKFLERADFVQVRFVPEFPPGPSGVKATGFEFQHMCRFNVAVVQRYYGGE